MRLRDSVVIVTGASAGIGKATAVLLARHGANVVLTARRADRLETMVEDLAAFPGKRISVPGNIQDEALCQELVACALAEFKRVDVLVNNAGLGHRSQIADMSTADMRTIVDTNVMGLLYATQAAIGAMKRERHGQIVNVSSIAGYIPLPGSAVYCASKTAINFIGRSLRAELRPYNITVTLVYPGRTMTEFSDTRLGQKGASRSSIGRISADRVGRSIVKAIETGRTDVYVTWYDWLITRFGRLFPRTTDWVLGRAIKVA